MGGLSEGLCVPSHANFWGIKAIEAGQTSMPNVCFDAYAKAKEES
jgi:hypothetical protein